MRFVIQPYVTGVPTAPLIGVPLGGPIVLCDTTSSPITATESVTIDGIKFTVEAP